MSSQRLDEALVTRGHFQSRSRARDAVLRHTVFVNGEAARKPSQSVLENDTLTVDDAAQSYVSRAALKLIHALDHFQFEVQNSIALDIGASTGGFTQVLLERGATKVIAVDVGHGQMVESLRHDPRVVLFEGLNARDISREQMPETVSMIVCDVSFISLRIALSEALALPNPGTRLIALIKPQFEVGRDFVGKGGVVSDPAQHIRVCTETKVFLEDHGWSVNGVTPSPLPGGDGNREFLIAAQR